MNGTNIHQRVFSFDKVALILGFIVDTITLSSILLSWDIKANNTSNPSFITPGLALMIWLLAFYIYLAFLHSHWLQNMVTRNYYESFLQFLIGDLIIDFGYPMLLFPGFVSLVTFFWILYLLDESHVAFWILLPGTVLMGGFLLATIAYAKFSTPITEEFKQRVKSEWGMLEEFINAKLSRKALVTRDDLSEIATNWLVPVEHMEYVLNQYALKHVGHVDYSVVKMVDSNKLIDDGRKVLILPEKIDRSIYNYV